jgi:hypothetical protein
MANVGEHPKITVIVEYPNQRFVLSGRGEAYTEELPTRANTSIKWDKRPETQQHEVVEKSIKL